MSGNILKRIYINPFLIVIFLLPVIFSFALTIVGFYFGTNHFDLGVIADHLYSKPYIVKASYPSTNYKIGPIDSYTQAMKYHEDNGEIYEVRFFENFEINDLNTLKMIVDKHIVGKRRDTLLNQIDSFQIFSDIQKVIDYVRLDWVTLIVGFLLFTVMFYNFGRRVLIVLVWYIFWFFIAKFGYFAYWLLPFRQPHIPHLFGFYEEYTHSFFEQFSAIALLIEVFVVLPVLYFFKFYIVKIFPKFVGWLKKVRESNKF